MIEVVGFEQDTAPPIVPLGVTPSPSVVAIGVATPASVDPAPPAPTPVAVDRQLPIEIVSDAAGLSIERRDRIAADDHLQSEIDALGGSIGPTIAGALDPIDKRQDDDDAERRAAEAAINQALADELAARAAADAAEAAARGALASATTQALAQAASDIQAAHDAADAAVELAHSELETAKGDLQSAIDAVQASSDGVAALVSAETTARQTADSAEVTARQAAIAGVQTDIGTVAAALSAEQTVRANADSAETLARQSAISGVQTAISDALAAITAEASTRASADTAETNARTAAISSLQGALSDALAAITTEASTRATADTAETNARQAAISAVQTAISDAMAAITAEATTRANADTAETNARQAAISAVETSLATVNAAITAEANTRASADTAETNARNSQVSNLQGQINDATAAISAEANTRATNEAAETAERKSAVSAVSAKGSPKRIWTQSTAPVFADLFPPGVQACVFGNLDNPSSFGAGIDTLTNTGRVITRGMDLDGWTLDGGHTLFAWLNGAWAAQGSYECFDINGFGYFYGLTPGASYEWSAYTGAHRCRVQPIIVWLDSNNSALGDTQGQAGVAVNDWELAGGAAISGYKRTWVRAVAPANAVRCYVILRGDNYGANNKAGQVSPYIFATRPQFCRVAPSAAAPVDWQAYDAPVWINSGDSNKILRWSGLYGATWVEQSDTRIAAAQAAITSEASTRATADAAETSQRQSAISAVQTDIASNLAAIQSEASTRATADSAETSARQSAVSGLQNSVNSINAAITTEQNTRAAADLAETTSRQQQVSQISTPGGALIDPLFSRGTVDQTLAWGWGDWSWGTTLCHTRASGKIGPQCLEIADDGAHGRDIGAVILSTWGGWSGVSHATNRYFVVEVDFEYVSGDLRGAGVLFNGGDNVGALNWDANCRWGFKDVVGGSPQTGKIYALRKFVDGYSTRVPPDPSQAASYLHMFGGWSTIYADQGMATGQVAKTVRVHRANVRAATQTEIEAGTVGGAIGAAITNEAATRASQIAAETSQRQSAVSSLQDGLNAANAAIVTEQNTRAAADASEALARTTLSSALSAQINPKRIYLGSTAPTFAQLFPPGVQACPLGNLDVASPWGAGLDTWTNTARTISRGMDLSGWTLDGGHTVYAYLNGNWAAQSTYECFDINNWGPFPNITAGATYEFSAYTGAHRGRLSLGLIFYDAGGATLSNPSSAVFNDWEAVGGSSLSGYKRLWVRAPAPAGAVKCLPYIRCDNQGANNKTGQASPYIFATRGQFARVTGEHPTPLDWQPFQTALWLDSANGNKANLWSGIYGATWVAADDARISANATSISQVMSTTDGLKAMWGVQIDSNGKVTGRVKLDGTGGTSEFSVLATSFTVSMPGYNSPIFEVGYVAGTPKVTIRADVIADGAITDGKVGDVNLNAPTFASGTNTASVTVALRGGQTVAIIAKASSASPGQNSAQTVSIKNGSTTLVSEQPAVSTIPDGSGGYYYKIAPAVLLTSFTPSSTGNYTFSIEAPQSSLADNYHPAVSIYVDRPYK